MASLLLSLKSAKIWEDTAKDKGPNPTGGGRYKKATKQQGETGATDTPCQSRKKKKKEKPFAVEKSLLPYRGDTTSTVGLVAPQSTGFPRAGGGSALAQPLRFSSRTLLEVVPLCTRSTSRNSAPSELI